MPARLILAASFVFALQAAIAVEATAGSGTRSASNGSSYRSSGSSSRESGLEDFVWEYEGELERGELDGETEATIAGRFRLADNEVFSVPMPAAEDEGSEGSTAREGSGAASGPAAASPFRTVAVTTGDDGESRAIGKYRVTRSGKMTLILNDGERLNGAMVLRQIKNQGKTVMVGKFREKEDKKTVRTWEVTVRAVEDESA